MTYLNTELRSAGLCICLALTACTNERHLDAGTETETGSGEDGAEEASSSTEEAGSSTGDSESSSSGDGDGDTGGGDGDGDTDGGDGDTDGGDGDGDTGTGLDCELLSQVEITDVQWNFTTPNGWQPTDDLFVQVTLSNPTSEPIDYVGARILSDEIWLIDIESSVNWFFVLGPAEETAIELVVQISPFATEAQTLSLTAVVVGIDENQCPGLNSWDFVVDMSAP